MSSELYAIKLAWLSSTRLNVCFLANMASQVTKEDFSKKQLKEIYKLIRRVKETAKRGLRYHCLNKSTLCFVAISESSFGNNEDLSSKLGHIIVATDDSGRANILTFGNYKSKRVVPSLLGTEIYAFAYLFVAFFHYLRQTNQVLTNMCAYCHASRLSLFISGNRQILKDL